MVVRAGNCALAIGRDRHGFDAICVAFQDAGRLVTLSTSGWVVNLSEHLMATEKRW
jgi:hypothetical protein